MEFITLEDIDRVVRAIHERTSFQPEIGMILGSGLGLVAEAVEGTDWIPAGDIPGWPVPTVEMSRMRRRAAVHSTDAGIRRRSLPHRSP